MRQFSVGDLVTDDFYEELGMIISPPRLSADCDLVKWGVGAMSGDVYEVVDVLCPDGNVRLFTTDELRKISESR